MTVHRRKGFGMTYKILVTGGAGYLGSVLVPTLLRLGHEVTVLDNFMFSPTSLLECCRYDNFEVFRGDARDKALIDKLVSDKDVIIPLAALVGAPLCNRDTIGAETINTGAIRIATGIVGTSLLILVNTKIPNPRTNHTRGK